MPSPATLAEYYADPRVRARIAEYCGGGPDRTATAVYLAGMVGSEHPYVTWDMAPRFPMEALDSLLDRGADVARSLWDRDSVLLHLDFDYLNVDRPGEAHTHPAETFYKIEPTYRAAVHVFQRHGLAMLPIVTGRGYHFTGRLPLASGVTADVAALSAQPPTWLRTFDERRPAWPVPEIRVDQARTYVGLGMLAEYLAHEILKRARSRTPIPVVLDNTIVGTGEVGRECVSIDLSYGGDPMDVRHMRSAFGAYQKHRFRPDLFGPVSAHPATIAVPRRTESIEHMLSHRGDLRHAARLARSGSVQLPDATDGVARVLEAYGKSRLAAFHRAYQEQNDDVADGGHAVPPQGLPACVARAFATPNDLLLQPAFIEHVTRVLIADGLSPRDIATLILRRYQGDYGWGPRWGWMDRESRAFFDVRVFSGVLMSGLDRAVDLNCRSAQEKGLCPGGECGRDLRVTRARLLEVMRT